MSIASFSIRRRVTVFMATIGVIVLGFFSLNRLELKLLPDISYPSLTVRTEMEGAPPEEIETLISRPIEEALGIVSSLQQITSISRAGLSDVIVEFHWNTPMDKALMDVREKLDTITLPDSAERPRILRYNPETEPVLTLALTGENLVDMYSFADVEMKPKLETLPGVAAVRIMGGDKEEILIEIDTPKIAALGLTLSEIAGRLTLENVNLPGGMLEEGDSRFLVRTMNEFMTESSIGDVVISSVGGVDVRLRDLASITRSTVEQKTITQLNGHPSVLLDVYKEGDANIIAVADEVRKQLGTTSGQGSKTAFMAMIPDEMQIELISDQSTFIRAAIDEVYSAAIFGCLLAIAVIYIFLRHLPNTLIIGLSIPISIIATFTLMFFKGISLNLMSLGGLALGIGMLVDNSIVVLENIFRLKERQHSPESSARLGTEQVTTAVIASTLTTIAVFFPILFVSGIAGQIFNDLAWTIAFSLLASLIVALSFIPMVASLARQSDQNPNDVITIVGLWRSSALHNRHPVYVLRLLMTTQHLLQQIAILFGRFLRKELSIPFKRISPDSKTATLGLTILLFPFRFVYRIISLTLTIAGYLIVNLSWILIAAPSAVIRLVWRFFVFLIKPFLNAFDSMFAIAEAKYLASLNASLIHPFRAPLIVIFVLVIVGVWIIPQLGMNLIPSMAQGEFFVDLKLPVGSSLEQTHETVSRMETEILSIQEIQSVSSVIGSDMTTSTSLGAEQEHMATLQILLKHPFRNQAAEARIIDQLRGILSNVSGIQKQDFRRPSLFTLRNPLVVEVRGNNLDAIMSASQSLTESLRRDSMFKDVTGSMESGYPEIQIVFDRLKLARLSLTPSDAAMTLRNAIEGNIPTRFGLVGEEIDVRVRADQSAGMNPDDLQRLVIDPKSTPPVYLSSVADVSRSIGPSEIRRINQRRVALVKTDTPLLDLRRATTRIEAMIAGQPDTPGVFYAVTGQTGEMQESAQSLIIALGMAVFLVYLVMASQFESLLQPLIILFAIPMGFIGVIVGLYILNIAVSIVVFIGLIVLAGIVVNNAIVLVDTTNNLIRSGTTISNAIRDAAQQRLRPILMTATTTVLGLLPMAITSGPGQEIRQPLAITVILGLVVSTFLTLILIPTLYSLIYRHNSTALSPVTKED